MKPREITVSMTERQYDVLIRLAAMQPMTPEKATVSAILGAGVEMDIISVAEMFDLINEEEG